MLSSRSTSSSPRIPRQFLTWIALTACLVPAQEPAPRWPPEGPPTLHLTWLGRPTTSITVQWLEPGSPQGLPPRSAAIRYAPSGNSGRHRSSRTTVHPFGSSGLWVQRAELPDLRPDTLYQMRIGGSEEALSFRTAPERLDRPLVFAEGGDVGQRPDLVHRQVASWDPLFALIGGDIAYANGVDSDRWIQFLTRWRQHMVTRTGRLIPIVCAIGNHETVRDQRRDQHKRAPFFLALFTGPRHETTYRVFDIGKDVSILLLDSDHYTQVAGPQTRWLASALQQRRDKPHLLVAYHTPAYPSVRRPNMTIRRLWVPLFEHLGVDVVFEHGDHAYKRTHLLRGNAPHPNGILYLGDGGWGMKPRVPKSPQQRSYLKRSIASRNVIQVTLERNSRKFIVVDQRGEVLDHYPEDEP